MNINNQYCRVCGLFLGYNPWGNDCNSPDYSICACCGCEVGYNDYTPESVFNYRVQWIKQNFCWKAFNNNGLLDKSLNIWFIQEEKPRDWNPLIQLKDIDIDFTVIETVNRYKLEIPNIEEIINPWI